MEKEMATHSSVLAWRIPRTEEPGGLRSLESQCRTQLRDWQTQWRKKTHTPCQAGVSGFCLRLLRLLSGPFSLFFGPQRPWFSQTPWLCAHALLSLWEALPQRFRFLFLLPFSGKRPCVSSETPSPLPYLQWFPCYFQMFDFVFPPTTFILLPKLEMISVVVFTCFYNEFVLVYLGSVEKEMTTHSSILAWKIPWMEELGWLQSIELPRVGHDWAALQSGFKLWFSILWIVDLD